MPANKERSAARSAATRELVRSWAHPKRTTAAVAGGTEAIPAYLRGAGLALPLIVDALDSAGDTLTGEEACGIALGVLRRVVPRRDGATERPRARKE